MSRSLLTMASILCAFALAGCEEAPTQPSTTPGAAAVAVTDDDLAVPAEFEEEADKSITVANYKAELDTLETEIQ
jgi:hypothetical protein